MSEDLVTLKKNEAVEQTEDMDLAPVPEKNVVFKQQSDLSVWKVMSEETKKPLCIISGYDLQMNFNMEHLRSVEDIEACIEGLGKIFREIILEKIFENKPQE